MAHPRLLWEEVTPWVLYKHLPMTFLSCNFISHLECMNAICVLHFQQNKLFMHSARSGGFHCAVLSWPMWWIFDPSIDSLYGSTQVVNIHYLGQIHFLGQNRETLLCRGQKQTNRPCLLMFLVVLLLLRIEIFIVKLSILTSASIYLPQQKKVQ